MYLDAAIRFFKTRLAQLEIKTENYRQYKKVTMGNSDQFF